MTAIIVDPSRSIPRHKFRSSPEAETRLLLLIDGFSRKRGGEVRSLEGRVKLAKLDFLLRYPKHLVRVLESIGVGIPDSDLLNLQEAPLDSRMMRYRYGPWDPSYYAVLGSLIGRGLVKVEPLPRTSGLGYSTTSIGASLASELRPCPTWPVGSCPGHGEWAVGMDCSGRIVGDR
ncbi:hypothetical protein ACH4CD_25030, partial [Streptomyces fungicidicus]